MQPKSGEYARERGPASESVGALASAVRGSFCVENLESKRGKYSRHEAQMWFRPTCLRSRILLGWGMYGVSDYKHTSRHKEQYLHAFVVVGMQLASKLSRYVGTERGLGCCMREKSHITKYAHIGNLSYQRSQRVRRSRLHP